MASQKEVVISLLRGEVSTDDAAATLGVSTQAVGRLKRRYLKSKQLPRRQSVKAAVDQPTEILRDTWGVAHIEAASTADCFTALGYAMAQDRLWQMDYMRRVSHGRLAEVMGIDYLAQDRLHRTLGLTRAAQGAASVMSDEVKMVLQSLARGINAWIEGAGDRLPVEFDLLDYKPEPWSVVDSIAIWKWRWWMLTGRLGIVALGEVAKRHLSPSLQAVFLSVEAADETIVPGPSPVAFGGDDTGIGSNNWVLGGSLTEKGKPVLATDPHNDVSLSRQWYQAQVTAPGLDAIGAFYLGTPGIYLGHNRKTSWGETNHTASVRDLYVEEVSAEDGNLYREDAAWQAFEVDHQEIGVRGEQSDPLVIRRTVRGPIVNAFVPAVDEGPQPVLSMRWVGLEPTTGFESMLALMRSQDVSEVLAALKTWPMPILNFVFSDVSGRIGYHAVGHVPRRRADAVGFRPANDPDHVWGEPYAFEELPKMLDPERDWVGTANNAPWGGDGAYIRLGSWSDGYRFRRLRKRVAELETFDLRSVGAIHADAIHARACELSPFVAAVALKARNKGIRELGALLEAWDGHYSVTSVAATVFATFWELWARRLARRHFPEDMIELVAGRMGFVSRQVLTGEDTVWMPEASATDEIRETLVDTLSWLRVRAGSRKSQWRWGRLHTVTFRHPLSDGGELTKLFDVGPFETSGTQGTLRSAGFAFSAPFEVTGLSTFRMVVDMADPARALATAAGGQSGHPTHENYRTQSKLWVADDYHPLLMDRQDIVANLGGSVELVP